MKKKYYFNSVWFSLVYVFITLPLIALLVICFFADEIHSGVIFVITVFSISIGIILFWVGFSFLMRIEIDHEKKELYILHSYFIKRMKFEEITSIEIIDISPAEVHFVVSTNKFSKKIAYTRYYKSRPSPKIQAVLDDLKNDLMQITN